MLVAALRAGRYEVEDVRVLAGIARPREIINDVSGLATAVADPGLVQDIRVNSPADVDLAVFEPLTSLRPWGSTAPGRPRRRSAA
ncbi:hypothetical protein GCM10029964_072410 [Kibdelosporangium lantanae]